MSCGATQTQITERSSCVIAEETGTSLVLRPPLSGRSLLMAAVPSVPGADLMAPTLQLSNVHLWHKADIVLAWANVRFRG
jgi:hypothetical protein